MPAPIKSNARNDIPPIPRSYNGILFRSTTEARWAVFFHSLGVAYQYECEGYDINGTWYLPDFWIPEWGHFIEIKPRPATDPPPTPEAFRLIRGLQDLSGARALIFQGNPGFSSYRIWFPYMQPDISPVLIGDCRKCPTGIWYFSDGGYGPLAGCPDDCPSEKPPSGDTYGRVGAALSEAASYRFPRGAEMLSPEPALSAKGGD